MFGIVGVAVGIFLLLLGIFLIFFFPQTTVHQGEGFSIAGIVMGFIFLIVGIVLIFT